MASKLLTIIFLSVVTLCCQGASILVGKIQANHFKSIQARANSDFGNYDFKHLTREQTELILLHHALQLGGYQHEIHVHGIDHSYLRGLQLVTSGTYSMLGYSVWKSTVSQHSNLNISLPLVAKGDYQVGLYTMPSNQRAMSTRRFRDLENLVAVSQRGYTVDWETLEGLNLKDIIHTSHWGNMIKLIHSGRADFMLLPFQNTPNMALVHPLPYRNDVKEVTLVPIPEVTVYLNDDRVWAINSLRPDGIDILQALNKGITQMRQEGIIRKAFVDSGLINIKTQHWTVINQPQTETKPETSKGKH